MIIFHCLHPEGHGPLFADIKRGHCSFLFVYVIGLHAVQFGNNWMRKIPRNISTRKLTIVKQHDVSTTSYRHCQISKMEITDRHIYRY